LNPKLAPDVTRAAAQSLRDVDAAALATDGFAVGATTLEETRVTGRVVVDWQGEPLSPLHAGRRLQAH